MSSKTQSTAISSIVAGAGCHEKIMTTMNMSPLTGGNRTAGLSDRRAPVINEVEYRKWLETRPAVIQELAERFPVGSAVLHEGELLYLCGYNEDGSLLVSQHNPDGEYEIAQKTRVRVCVDCVELLERQ